MDRDIRDIKECVLSLVILLEEKNIINKQEIKRALIKAKHKHSQYEAMHREKNNFPC
jgi:hypothetical protein